MKRIKYTKLKKGLFWGLLSKDRNRLDESFSAQTQIKDFRVFFPYIRLDKDGLLTISKGFIWDGASGPTIDTETTMRASCVHDALYCLVQRGLLPSSVRWRADLTLYRIMREDGAWGIRSMYWLAAVDLFGIFAVRK